MFGESLRVWSGVYRVRLIFVAARNFFVPTAVQDCRVGRGYQWNIRVLLRKCHVEAVGESKRKEDSRHTVDGRNPAPVEVGG